MQADPITVRNQQDGITLAALMRAHLPGQSWSRVRQLIAGRRIKVNGELCLDPARRLRQDDCVELLAEAVPPVRHHDALVLRHLDHHLVVVEKPSGIATVRHPTERHWTARRKALHPTLEDLLRSAQFIVACGNPDVILCERGIRTFETATRNTFDVAAVPVLKTVSHLPVIVDPSHAAGVRVLVPIFARAAVVVGAHGLLVEVHPNPDEAASDGDQSLTFEQFDAMMMDLDPYLSLRAVGEKALAASAGLN